MDMFKAPALQELIAFKYDNFGKRFHLVGCIIHFVYMVILFIYLDIVYIHVP